MRETQVNIRLSEEEHARFKRVADRLGLNIPGAIRLLMRQADDAVRDEERRAWLEGEEQWERDKKLVAWLIPLVNRFQLEAVPDDRTRTFTIESPRVPPIGTRGPLSREETIDALVTWQGGDILMFDPHTRVVTRSPSRNGTIRVEEPPEDALDPTALEALRRWRERQRREEDEEKAAPRKRRK